MFSTIVEKPGECNQGIAYLTLINFLKSPFEKHP
jgi:hypothetical protein